jgi:hypothetical protein
MLLHALLVQDRARGESRDFVAAEQRLDKRALNHIQVHASSSLGLATHAKIFSLLPQGIGFIFSSFCFFFALVHLLALLFSLSLSLSTVYTLGCVVCEVLCRVASNGSG